MTTAAGGGASALWGAQFHGTAQVSVQVYDHCSVDGSRRPSGSQTYSMPATLALDRPREGGGQREGNPFTLVLSVGQPSQVGAVSLWSSGVFAAPSGQLLLTFWKLSRDGGTLRGQLTDAHTQEGAGLNLVNWSGPLVACRPELGTLPIGTPHQVAVGTGLSGRLTAQSASLAVKGSSGDGVLDFSIDFTGSR
ncbi:hypothetical protein [Kitasatospora sp. NPDC086791]|uniref:hypothetical protein n=1 Tax=Kitasatospora sp. NPDC086791 TaxID=3155178 RepID=UPI00342B6354